MNEYAQLENAFAVLTERFNTFEKEKRQTLSDWLEAAETVDEDHRKRIETLEDSVSHIRIDEIPGIKADAEDRNGLLTRRINASNSRIANLERTREK